MVQRQLLSILTTLVLSWKSSIISCWAFEDWPELKQYEFGTYDPSQNKTLDGRGTTECHLNSNPGDVNQDDQFYNIGIIAGIYDGSCYPYPG